MRLKTTIKKRSWLISTIPKTDAFTMCKTKTLILHCVKLDNPDNVTAYLLHCVKLKKLLTILKKMVASS